MDSPQIIALVGEDIATELESDGESSSLDLPSPPRPVTPLPNREAMTVSGEVPPAIPMRTLAYMELLEEDAPPPLPTTPIPSRDLAIRKSASSEAIKTMTGVYEAPTECECWVEGVSVSVGGRVCTEQG